MNASTAHTTDARLVDRLLRPLAWATAHRAPWLRALLALDGWSGRALPLGDAWRSRWGGLADYEGTDQPLVHARWHRPGRGDASDAIGPPARSNASGAAGSGPSTPSRIQARPVPVAPAAERACAPRQRSVEAATRGGRPTAEAASVAPGAVSAGSTPVPPTETAASPSSARPAGRPTEPRRSDGPARRPGAMIVGPALDARARAALLASPGVAAPVGATRRAAPPAEIPRVAGATPPGAAPMAAAPTWSAGGPAPLTLPTDGPTAAHGSTASPDPTMPTVAGAAAASPGAVSEPAAMARVAAPDTERREAAPSMPRVRPRPGGLPRVRGRIVDVSGPGGRTPAGQTPARRPGHGATSADRGSRAADAGPTGEKAPPPVRSVASPPVRPVGAPSRSGGSGALPREQVGGADRDGRYAAPGTPVVGAHPVMGAHAMGAMVDAMPGAMVDAMSDAMSDAIRDGGSHPVGRSVRGASVAAASAADRRSNARTDQGAWGAGDQRVSGSAPGAPSRGAGDALHRRGDGAALRREDSAALRAVAHSIGAWPSGVPVGSRPPGAIVSGQRPTPARMPTIAPPTLVHPVPAPAPAVVEAAAATGPTVLSERPAPRVGRHAAEASGAPEQPTAAPTLPVRPTSTRRPRLGEPERAELAADIQRRIARQRAWERERRGLTG